MGGVVGLNEPVMINEGTALIAGLSSPYAGAVAPQEFQVLNISSIFP